VGGLSLRAALTYLLWLLDLPAPLLERLHERLRFSLGLYKALRAASALRSDLPGLRGQPASAWVRRLEDVPLAAVYAVFLASRSPDLEQYALRWRHVHPRTTGETLKALGLPPGPAYQRILWHLRAAWLDGAVTSAEQETALLHELLRGDQ
jgi:tRNA nucleotidyltransferase (CCA-adding enzyme)